MNAKTRICLALSTFSLIFGIPISFFILPSLLGTTNGVHQFHISIGITGVLTIALFVGAWLLLSDTKSVQLFWGAFLRYLLLSIRLFLAAIILFQIVLLGHMYINSFGKPFSESDRIPLTMIVIAQICGLVFLGYLQKWIKLRE